MDSFGCCVCEGVTLGLVWLLCVCVGGVTLGLVRLLGGGSTHKWLCFRTQRCSSKVMFTAAEQKEHQLWKCGLVVHSTAALGQGPASLQTYFRPKDLPFLLRHDIPRHQYTLFYFSSFTLREQGAQEFLS